MMDTFDWPITNNNNQALESPKIERYPVVSSFGLFILATRGELRAKDMG
jgi:hypothetical protein